MSLRTRVNERVHALAGDSAASIADLVTALDGFCAQFQDDVAVYLGEAAGRLFLLKLCNLIVSKHEFLNRHTHLIAHPVGMLIDPSNGCGLRCPGCVHSGNQTFWSWPFGLLKPDVYRSFIEEHGPYAIDLYFANYGEPLLSPQTPAYVRMARQFGLPSFSSSSLSVPPKRIEGLVESGINFLIVSIDGATEDVYGLYRRQGRFDQVIANLESLVETKRRLGSYTPVLHWQFLVFEHNRHEVDSVIELARRIGVNELGLIRPFSVTWDDPAIHADETWQSQVIIFDRNERALARHLAAMTDDLAEEVIARHFALSWRERLDRSRKTASERDRTGGGAEASRERPCNWLYKSLTMDARGRMMPCARPPTTSGDLIFSSYDQDDHFNSPMHLRARELFLDPSEVIPAASEDGQVPYCARCEHRDQKSDIDTGVTVLRLLEDVDLYSLLDDESRVLLTDW